MNFDRGRNNAAIARCGLGTGIDRLWGMVSESAAIRSRMHCLGAIATIDKLKKAGDISGFKTLNF